MFSILIPTWNNLDYLKLCVASIRKNSSISHQIILHINEGSDGTEKWAREEQLDHSYTSANVGICKGMNLAAQKAKNPLLLYLNDDMYCCPGWDQVLLAEVSRLNTTAFMLSSTLIEPLASRNNCVIVQDFGKDLEGFREQDLLVGYKSLDKPDWSGSTWPPSLIHREYWDKVGGYSEEFSPGMSSDDDLSMKMWQAGCRIFRGMGESKVYHFQCKSTARVIRNDGRRQFLFKWGINQSGFRKCFLRMGEPYSGPLPSPEHTVGYRMEKIRGWVKRGLSSPPSRVPLA